MKNLIYTAAVITAAALVFLKADECRKAETNDVVLANVEALASNEIDMKAYVCFGTGNITCPTTGKPVAGYYKVRKLE